MCLQTYEKDLCMLSNCGHVFHKECLKSFFEVEIANSKYPIQCPLPNCKINFSARDMNTFLSPEDIKIHKKYLIPQADGI